MLDNPAKGKVGVSSGLWQLKVEDWGEGKVMPTNPPYYYADENLTQEEATEKRRELEDSLNGK